MQVGCVAACVPTERLDDSVLAVAKTLTEGGPGAQATIKHLIRVVDGSDSKEGKRLFVKGVFEEMMKSKEAAYENDLKKTTLRLCKELAGTFPIPISEHAKNLAAFATTPSVQAEYGLDVTDRLTQLYLVAFALPPLPVVKPRQRHVIDWSRAIAETLWVLFSQTQTAERKYSHLADMISALPLSFHKIEPQTGFVAEDDDPELGNRFDVIPFIKDDYPLATLLLHQWGSVAGHLSRLIAGELLETPDSETYPRLLRKAEQEFYSLTPHDTRVVIQDG
ncbi:UNVERIFIED_CONTAM: hypothetical protein HDU68_008093 [Siphonaria sp. JEL0065]|nr:hypothetical protein HDU68_008093 [Siphonaria sp. JEL0065]